MKKIAIIVGGWHYPIDLYKKVSNLSCPDGYELDRFVISHRDPDLEIVYNEKKNVLSTLSDLDNELYAQPVTKDILSSLGYYYDECENIYGDYFFINQWLELYDYSKYDYIFFMHDDNFILNTNLIKDIVEHKCKLYRFDNSEIDSTDWLMIYNTNAPGTTTPRGSFACFKNDFISKLGLFNMDGITMMRKDKIDTPEFLNDLKEWNNITRNLNKFIQENNLRDFIVKLGIDYRTSDYILECERGFCINQFIK